MRLQEEVNWSKSWRLEMSSQVAAAVLGWKNSMWKSVKYFHYWYSWKFLYIIENVLEVNINWDEIMV